MSFQYLIKPFCVVLILLSGCGQKPASPQIESGEYDQFPEFWTLFRKAALNEDWKTLSAMTTIPLKTRGMMDDMPEIEFKEAELPLLFPLFLASPTGLNMDNLNETHKEYFQYHPQIEFTDNRIPMMSGDKKASITSMEFEKTENGWKLTFLYLDENVYNQLGKDIAF